MRMVKKLGLDSEGRKVVDISRSGVLNGLFGNVVIVGERCGVCGKVHGKGKTLVCFRRYFVYMVENDEYFRRMVMGLWERDCYCKGCRGNSVLCHGEVIRSWLYVNNEGVR